MPRMEPPPPPRMEAAEPPPPPPPEQLEVAAAAMKVHFFGVADKNWNLGIHGIGIKKGTTGRGEFCFNDIVSLKIEGSNAVLWVRDSADVTLMSLGGGLDVV